MKKLLIAIPAYGQSEYLNETLKTLAENNAESIEEFVETTVLVIDDGTPEGLAVDVPHKSERWHQALIRLKDNGGVTKAWNLAIEFGMRKLDADYVMICNSDVHFGPNVLKACMQAIDVDGHYAVFPQTYAHKDQNGNARYGGALPQDFDKASTGAASNLLNVVVTGGVAGWCFMLSKECLDKVGWFDPRFVLWYGDTDYLNRLSVAGKLPGEVRNCLIHHYESRTIVSMDGGFGCNGWIGKDKELFSRKYPKT